MCAATMGAGERGRAREGGERSTAENGRDGARDDGGCGGWMAVAAGGCTTPTEYGMATHRAPVWRVLVTYAARAESGARGGNASGADVGRWERDIL